MYKLVSVASQAKEISSFVISVRNLRCNSRVWNVFREDLISRIILLFKRMKYWL